MSDLDEKRKPPSASDLVSVSRLLLSVLVGVTMTGLVVVTFVDVVGRYSFNAPIPGAFEYVKYLLGLCIFACFPLITGDRTHITVGMLDNLLTGKWHSIRELTVFVASLCGTALVAYALWVQAETLRQADVISEFLEFQIAPVVYVMFGLALVALAFLLRSIWLFVRPEKPDHAKS